MRHSQNVLIAVLLLGSCGTSNVLEKYEKAPEDLDKAARFLEDGNPEAARAALLAKVPEAARLILTTENPDLSTGDYTKNLAASLKGVAEGDKVLSMYATAEAGVQKVNALNIMVEILGIDDQLKKDQAALSLTATADDQEAIGKFYPAMPGKCKTLSIEVNRGLDKAIAIIYATAILRGFNPEELTSKARELRASLTRANMFNNAIFTQVNFICRIMNLDMNEDKKISAEEAAQIGSLTEATNIYNRIQSAIDAVQAMVDVNPDDKNLAKALKRMSDYKSKIDNDSGATLLEKLISFLVSQSA